MSEMPLGWECENLENLGVWTGGGTPSKARKDFWENGSVPWVSPKDMKRLLIDEAIDNITELAVEQSSTKLIPPNSILMVTRSGILAHTFPVSLNTVSVTVNQDIKALSPNKLLNALYLVHGLRTYGQRILHTCSKDGTTVASIETEALKSFPFPIAPVPEQHRIVEAIESYLSRLDDAVAGLERVQKKLKQYRASVLKAAVEGRLVPTEAQLAREEHRTYEPADVLLKRILEERKERWQAAENEKLKVQGRSRSTKTKAKCAEPIGPQINNLPPLPEGWCWTTLDQLTHFTIDYRGKTPPTADCGVPIISAANVKNGELVFKVPKFVSKQTYEKHAVRGFSQPGDLIVTTEAPVGECAIYPANETFLLTRRVIGFQTGLLDNRFLYYCFQSTSAAQHLKDHGRGTTVPRILKPALMAMPIPLAPFHEQKRIIQTTERHLEYIKKTMAQIGDNIQCCQRLRQSILKWAFEGKLVDQDPNDEPASVLLERIKAEKAARAAKPKATRRGRKRNTP